MQKADKLYVNFRLQGWWIPLSPLIVQGSTIIKTGIKVKKYGVRVEEEQNSYPTNRDFFLWLKLKLKYI